MNDVQVDTVCWTGQHSGLDFLELLMFYKKKIINRDLWMAMKDRKAVQT